MIQTGVILNSMAGCSLLRPAPSKEIAKDVQMETVSKNNKEQENTQDTCGRLNNNSYQKESNQTSSQNLIDWKLLKNVSFWIFNLGAVFAICGSELPRNHAPSRAVYVGIKRESIGYIPFLFGLCQFISRPLGGVLANLKLPKCTLIRQYIGGILVAEVFVILIGFTGKSFTLLIICVCLSGVSEGKFRPCFLILSFLLLLIYMRIKSVVSFYFFLK